MARSQPSDANICRLIRVIGIHFAVSIDDVQDILKLKPRQAGTYIRKLQNDGVLYVRYRENKKKYYSLRTKDEVRTTN